MQMETGTQDVERVIQSLEETQREFADRWSEVVRTTADSNQRDATEAILQSQSEIMRSALRWMDPGNTFGALVSNWLTLPRTVLATNLELQRQIADAYTNRDDLRPEAIISRWGAPFLDATRAFQEAAVRMVEIQSALMRSIVAQGGQGQEQQQRSRGQFGSSGGRSRQSGGSQRSRSRRGGNRSAQSQRAH